jgi:redox-sensitive bicupin YhaK (pirin superfamily)
LADNLNPTLSGIAHSERTPPHLRVSGSELFGIQSWVALPKKYEESDPAFTHHRTDDLPIVEGDGKRVRLITGSLYGAHSPVHTLSEMFYADIMLAKGAHLPIPTEHEDRAAYIVEGTVGQHCAYIGGGIGSNDLLESSLGCDPTPLATASRAREF